MSVPTSLHLQHDIMFANIISCLLSEHADITLLRNRLLAIDSRINRIHYEPAVLTNNAWVCGCSDEWKYVIFAGIIPTAGQVTELVAHSLVPLSLQDDFGCQPTASGSVRRAQSIMEEHRIGARPNEYYAGHSQGGATSLVFAAQRKFEDSDINVNCTSFGSPKPGDGRLARALDRIPHRIYQNTGDWISNIPPDTAVPYARELIDWLREHRILYRPTLLLGDYTQPNGIYTLHDNGNVTEGQERGLARTVGSRLLALLQEGDEFEAVEPHRISQYITRLLAAYRQACIRDGRVPLLWRENSGFVFTPNTRLADEANEQRRQLDERQALLVRTPMPNIPSNQVQVSQTTADKDKTMFIPKQFKSRVVRTGRQNYVLFVDNFDCGSFKARGTAVRAGQKFISWMRQMAKAKSFEIGVVSAGASFWMEQASGATGSVNGFIPPMNGQ